MLEINTIAEDSATVIYLNGRLDVKAAKDADTAFAEAAQEANDVILDLKDLDYIASAGLRALKRLRDAVRKNGNALTVRNVQDNVMEVLDMTGFAAMLTFV